MHPINALNRVKIYKFNLLGDGSREHEEVPAIIPGGVLCLVTALEDVREVEDSREADQEDGGGQPGFCPEPGHEPENSAHVSTRVLYEEIIPKNLQVNNH